MPDFKKAYSIASANKAEATKNKKLYDVYMKETEEERKAEAEKRSTFTKYTKASVFDPLNTKSASTSKYIKKEPTKPMTVLDLNYNKTGSKYDLDKTEKAKETAKKESRESFNDILSPVWDREYKMPERPEIKGTEPDKRDYNKKESSLKEQKRQYLILADAIKGSDPAQSAKYKNMAADIDKQLSGINFQSDAEKYLGDKNSSTKSFYESKSASDDDYFRIGLETSKDTLKADAKHSSGAKLAEKVLFGGDFVGHDDNFREASEEQRKTMYYLIGKKDYKGFEDYYNSIKEDLQGKVADKEYQKEKDEAKKNPVYGAISNVTSGVMSVADGLANAVNATGENFTGKYSPMKASDPRFSASRNAQASSEGVTERAGDEAVNTFGDKARPTAEFLTSTGLSVLQSGAALATGNPTAAMGMMGGSAFGQGTYGAVERGASSSDAFMVGAANAAIEMITEKIPIDNLFKIARTAPSTAKEAVVSTLKQMGVEASEEMLSEVANNIVDLSVMGDKSEYNLYKQKLIENGMSEKEAEAKAFIQFFVTNTAMAGAGGALSGGVMGSGANILGGIGKADVNTEKYTNNAEVNGKSTKPKNGIFAPVFDKSGKMIGHYGDNLTQNADVNAESQSAAMSGETVKTEEKPLYAPVFDKKTGEYIGNYGEDNSEISVGKATTIKSPYKGKVPKNRTESQIKQPPIEIQSEAVTKAEVAINEAKETGQFKKSLRKTFETVFQNLGGARKITIDGVNYDEKPYEVSLNKNVIGKVISDPNISPEKAAVIYQIDEAIKTAQFVGSGNYGKNKAKAANVIRYDYFENDISINGQNYVMTFDAEVYSGVNNFRTYKIKEIDLTPTETNNDSEADAATHGSSTRGLTPEKSSLSNNSIRNTSENSNTSDEKLFETKKAEAYVKRSRNNVVREMKKAFNLPSDSKSRFSDTLIKMQNDYIQNGTISEADMQTAFQEIVDHAVEVDRTFYDTYKDAKEYLRNTSIKISDEVRNGIADFNDFRKRNTGRVKLTKDGLPIDTAYQELNAMFPDLFPDHIDNQSDQLQRMADVAEMIKPTETNLFDGADEDLKGFAYQKFRESVGKYQDALLQAAKYEADRIGKDFSGENALPDKVTLENVREFNKDFSSVKDAQKNYDKISARLLLTKGEREFSKKLREGVIETSAIPVNMDKDGILELADAGAVLDALNKPFADHKRKQNAKIQENADRLVENADEWEDKEGLFPGYRYSLQTAERNIRDVMPKEDAKKWEEEVLRPIHEHEAEANKVMNAYMEEVIELDLNQKESELTQQLGEGQIQESDIPQESREKVKNAVSVFRRIYDELLDMVNVALIENGYDPIPRRADYFPHFEDPNDETAKAFKLLGINVENDSLPTSITGMTHEFKPGKKYFANAQERKGTSTVYDAVRGYSLYASRIKDVIFHTGDIRKCRAIENAIRTKYSEEGVAEKIKEIRTSELPEYEKESKINELKNGATTRMTNFVNWFSEYTNILAGKKALADRDFEQKVGRKFYSVAKSLENNIAGSMVGYNNSSAYTNLIPLAQAKSVLKTKSMLRGMGESVVNLFRDDGFHDKSVFLTNRRGSIAVPMDFSEKNREASGALMNFFDKFTSEAIVRAKYYESLENGVEPEAAMQKADDLASSIMADRSYGSLPTVFAAKNPASKAFTMFQVEVNNQYQFFYKDMKRFVKDDDEAKGFAAAMVGAIAKYMLASWLYNEFYEAAVGRRSAFDPIDMINDFVGDMTGYKLPNTVSALTKGGEYRDGIQKEDFETKKKTTGKAIVNLGMNIGEELPFVGGLLFGGGRIPITSAIPDIERAFSMVGDEDFSQSKVWDVLLRNVAKPVAYAVGIPGASQIMKSAEGLATVNAGGAFSTEKDGGKKLQFPVEQSFSNYAKGTLFGKWALPGSQKYIDGETKALSTKKTGIAIKLRENGMPMETFIEHDKKLSAMKSDDDEGTSLKKRKYIDSLKLPEEQKALMYDAYVTSEKVKNAPDVAVAHLSESAQAKAKEANKVGLSYKLFAQYYEEMEAIKGDKNAKGNTVTAGPGSRKEKIRAYIHKLQISNAQKRFLYSLNYEENGLYPVFK